MIHFACVQCPGQNERLVVTSLAQTLARQGYRDQHISGV